MAKTPSTSFSQDQRNEARKVWTDASEKTANSDLKKFLKGIGHEEQFDYCLHLFTGMKSVPQYKQTTTLFGKYIQDKPFSQRKKLERDLLAVYKRMWKRRSIVNKEPNPEDKHYGLVVGRVQSGKTAHMLGLSALALDGLIEDTHPDFLEVHKREEGESRTKFVIVLTGLIDDLRIQSLRRGLKDLKLDKSDEFLVGPGEENDLTQDEKFSEKLQKTLSNSIESLDIDKKVVLFIKKNYKVLDRLTQLLGAAWDESDEKLMGSWLIIDDECDYASQDKNHASMNKKSKEAQTNESLRLMIKKTREISYGETWYIGYTATPFSNLLANPHAKSNELGPDLFPSGFISVVDPPSAHLNNSYYFDNGEGQTEHVRYVADVKTPERPVLDYFVNLHCISLIIKKVRNLTGHHASMIHVERYMDDHVEVLREIRDIVANLDRNSFKATMDRILDDEFGDLDPKEIVDIKSYIDNLDLNEIAEILNIEFIELNSREKELEFEFDEEGKEIVEFESKLIYEDDTPRNIIITGGQRIARGLTIEGLTTSFFTREAKKPKYDTMLQMARWNGYRAGYDDLVRIITEPSLADLFRQIVIAETDMRSQLQFMKDESDPIQEMVLILKFNNMEITGSLPKEELLNTFDADNPYYLPDKIYLTKPPELTCDSSTFAITDEFLDTVDDFSPFSVPPKHKKGTKDPKYSVALDVDQNIIQDYFKVFLSHYSIGSGESRDIVDKLLQSMDKGLIDHSWNVAFSLTNSAKKKEPLSFGEMVGLGDRNPKDDSGYDPIYTNYDEASTIDLKEGEPRTSALLLIYFADHANISSVYTKKLPIPLIMVHLPNPEGLGGSKITRVGGYRSVGTAFHYILEQNRADEEE